MTAALQALLTRVEAGDEVPSKLIIDAFGVRRLPNGWDAIALIKWILRDSIEAMGAAKALHNAVLPEWHWQLCSDMRDGVVEIWPHGMYNRIIKVGDEDEWIDPARAWLIAILRALIATPADTEGR